MPRLYQVTLIGQLKAAAPPRNRRQSKQDMERKRQRMREYYQKNKEHLKAKGRLRSKIVYVKRTT